MLPVRLISAPEPAAFGFVVLVVWLGAGLRAPAFGHECFVVPLYLFGVRVAVRIRDAFEGRTETTHACCSFLPRGVLCVALGLLWLALALCVELAEGVALGRSHAPERLVHRLKLPMGRIKARVLQRPDLNW